MAGKEFHQSSAWQRIRAAYLATLSEYVCMKCGKPDLAGYDLQVDHIVSGHIGDGEYEWNNDHDNLQVLCSQCNGRKSDKQDFTQKRVDWRAAQWF